MGGVCSHAGELPSAAPRSASDVKLLGPGTRMDTCSFASEEDVIGGVRPGQLPAANLASLPGYREEVRKSGDPSVLPPSRAGSGILSDGEVPQLYEYTPDGDGSVEDACCLAWTLSQKERVDVREDTLQRFHAEVAACLAYFGARILTDEATNGLILGRPLDSADMSGVDTLVRMGQLLCRWAQRQSPAFGLRIGVHVGLLRRMNLPNSPSRCSYFGEVCAEAFRLADVTAASGQAAAVHISKRAKDKLAALRQVRLAIAPTRLSYFLDADTEVNALKTITIAGGTSEGGSSDGTPVPHASPTVALSLTRDTGNSEDFNRKAMPFEEFVRMLQDHKVDTAKFGKGNAKSLQLFYQAVVHEQKSHLTVRDSRLERVVDLVRISLRFRDSENKLRELRIASQLSQAGNMRIRDQQLAMVLKVPEHGRWQEAVEKCFEQRFSLSAKTQRACFMTDMESYTYREERSGSETIPGIMTTYKSHNIVIMVKDKTKKELQKLGLPSGEEFSTDVDINLKPKRMWTWAPVGDHKEDELMTQLQSCGIDVADYSPQAFAELYDEVYEKKQSSLEVVDGEITRTIRIIKIWLRTDILNVDHILVTRSKFQKGRSDADAAGRPISMRMSADQDWEEAVQEALLLRLGVTADLLAALMSVETVTHRLTEEVAYSRSFPGLKTVYLVNEVSVRILDCHHRSWQFLGLPGGTDFTFARRESLRTGETDVVVTCLGWRLASEAPSTAGKRNKHDSRKPSVSDDAPINRTPSLETQGPPARRGVPAPLPWYHPALKVPGGDEAVAAPAEGEAAPPLVLKELMEGATTDWTRAKRAAARIRDEDYTCKDFFEDISAAFPELRLYCVAGPDEKTAVLAAGGRTAADEYQRTIGALFAVFWLMRLHRDGKESFCFGLSDDAPREGQPAGAVQWRPRMPAPEAVGGEQDMELRKRQAFYEKTEWSTLERLLMAAGLFREHGGPHDEHRTLAILVLMVIHDIMKLQALLPTVAEAHGDFLGYKPGETIMDHDAALSYILEHHPDVLPSFHGLAEAQRESIRFAHCKLEYNMGWLVQAEAPPGHLFGAFRRVVISGKASTSDIAFYFVHWFADLAGAEPFPLEGCEKFVLKFPQKVLAQFVDSFSIVMTLSPIKSETKVFEDYILSRWSSHDPLLGPAPLGRGAIARMRLIMMAQGDSKEILRQFSLLPEEDQNILSDEFALTGAWDQGYQREPLATGAVARGPAILIYYSPALMQKAGSKDPRGAMAILAELFRQARELWPLVVEEVGRTVVVRIDALKELEVPGIMQPEAGFSHVLQRTTNQDAFVKLLPASSFKQLDWSQHQILCFNPATRKKSRNISSATAAVMRRMSFSLPQLMNRFSFRRGSRDVM